MVVSLGSFSEAVRGSFAGQRVRRWVGTGQSDTESRQKATGRAGGVQEGRCGQQDSVEVEASVNLQPSLAAFGLGPMARMEHRAIGTLEERWEQEG